METARRLGISLRRLRGWVPRRETVHERRWGLVVRSTEWVESEWDAEQRGWMLALTAVEATRCRLCGGPRDECQGPDADDAWTADPLRCHKSTAVAVAAARVEAAGNPHPQALLWTTRRRHG